MGVSIFSPAKINLFLAVTGRRSDGYHNLVSVAAPLDFGDVLEAESSGQGPSFAKVSEGTAGDLFTLECDRAEVPVDETNLILRAARAFAAATGWNERVAFKLTKRIPLGAGLGGGSSNAVAALRALNQLSGGRLAEARLAELAAGLGSDCALFLRNAPVIMRGRGSDIEVLPRAAVQRLSGRRVLLFKPAFAISTAWAYGRMAASAGTSTGGSDERRSLYLPLAAAEARLAEWLRGDAAVEELFFNNLEAVAFEKYPALPVLLEKLRREFGAAAQMSGSGSACFALGGALSGRGNGPGGQVEPAPGTASMKGLITGCWGPSAFVQQARLA